MSHEAKQKAAFFRDSGWLMISTIVGGGMMMGVHFLSKAIGKDEYSNASTLLSASILIPTTPMQLIFTRETAAALALGNTRILAAKARQSSMLLFALWLLIAVVAFCWHGAILEKWKISQPITLWLFVLVTLASLVTPVFGGLLQGKQDFLWIGWTNMLNALLRVGLAALVVFFITRTAAGFMAGVLGGMVVVLAIMMWRTRDIWTGPTQPFAAGSFLREVIPLMVGFGACQVFFSFDAVAVGRFFSLDEAAPYNAAGVLSRALMWLVQPLVTVMFPKLVHASAKSEKSNLFGMTLLATGITGVVAAIGLSLLAPVAIKMVFTPDFVKPASVIIPWYAGAMIPLTLANVLINNLLAKADFRIVPWTAVFAGGYATTLWLWHPSFQAVLQTLAGFTIALFMVGAIFTWVIPSKKTVVAQ